MVATEAGASRSLSTSPVRRAESTCYDFSMSPAPSEAIDAQSLAEETLRILEMNELPLSTVAMRASRLARLLNEVDYERIFRYEVGGYPVQANGLMTDEDWRLAGLANRYFTHEDEASKKSETRAYNRVDRSD